MNHHRHTLGSAIVLHRFVVALGLSLVVLSTVSVHAQYTTASTMTDKLSVQAPVDTVALLFNYAVDCDGSIGVHSPAWVSVSTSSGSGISNITLDADNSYNYDFRTYGSNSRRWNIELQVGDLEQDAAFSLCAYDSAGNSTCISNVYHVRRLQSSPRIISLGSRRINSSVSYPLHIVNHGTGSEVLDEIQLTPDGNKAFSVYVPGLPLILAPGDSTTLPVIITCEALGNFNDTIAVRRGTCVSGIGMLAVNVTMTDEVSPEESIDATLFPNPASDKAVLQCTSTSMRSVELFDALGHRVMSRNLNLNGSTETALDLRNLAPGQYRCVVHSAQGMRSLPLTVVH